MAADAGIKQSGNPAVRPHLCLDSQQLFVTYLLVARNQLLDHCFALVSLYRNRVYS